MQSTIQRRRSPRLHLKRLQEDPHYDQKYVFVRVSGTAEDDIKHELWDGHDALPIKMESNMVIFRVRHFVKRPYNKKSQSQYDYLNYFIEHAGLFFEYEIINKK